MHRAIAGAISLGIVGGFVPVACEEWIRGDQVFPTFLACVLGGSILGAIIGGTGDIVDAVKRDTRPSKPEDVLDP